MDLQDRKRASWFLAVFFLASLAAGAEPEKTGSEPKDSQVADSKAEIRPAAAPINFRKELNLPYNSLTTLGARIALARRAPDPVALAHAAHELAVAEKVSGKKASLTSTAVLAEAAHLAKLRHEAAELKAALQIANEIAAEQKLDTELKQEIAGAQQAAQQESEAIRMNQEPTATPRKLLINNYTTQYIVITVNGYARQPEIPPGESRWFVIEHKWNPTVLEAYGDAESPEWGPRYIWGRFTTYTWNLN